MLGHSPPQGKVPSAPAASRFVRVPGGWRPRFRPLEGDATVAKASDAQVASKLDLVE